MKIQIDTSGNPGDKREHKSHNGLYVFLACAFLVFAVLYIHGFIEYSK